MKLCISLKGYLFWRDLYPIQTFSAQNKSGYKDTLKIKIRRENQNKNKNVI